MPAAMTATRAIARGGPAESDLLVIERLAAALEKAASVDEIKDVRDRAMAIQLYARKKVGGMAAAQSAGRVVTDATLMLARLYADEKGAPGKRTDVPLVRAQEVSKADIARAADLDPSALSRLRPLVEATAAEYAAAKDAVEAAGEICTPAALLRQVTATSSVEGYDGDEWYTPPDIIVRARKVLGEIDLDPASNAHAQKTVRAKRFLTKEDNALTTPWSGGVFCNPPYSMPLIEQFTAKLLDEREAKRVTAAIYLVNNCTDAGWFHSLLTSLHPVCFTRGRIGFMNRSGQKFATRQGQAIFYLGAAHARFAEIFAELGTVVRA